MCFQTESWIQGLVPGTQELFHWVTSPVHTGFLLKMNTPSHLKAWKGYSQSAFFQCFIFFFFWDSVKVNFQCDTELPHLTTGKPGNATLPRKFSHEFAKPGVFLWVPEQLQQTLILEIDRGRFWELWVASADKHHQWCQQSRFVFRQARASHGGISRRKQRKEKELLFIFKSCWAVRL